MRLAEKYSALTPENRKRLLLALVVGGVLAFLWMPSYSELWRAIPQPIRRLYPGDTPARPVKPSPFDGQRSALAHAVPAPLPPPPEMAAGLPMPGTLLGNWMGRSLIPKRGICTLSVEMRGQSAEGEPVIAYSTLQCLSVQLMMPGLRPGGKPLTPEEVLAASGRLTPVSFVLSGAWETGSIRFLIQKSIGTNPGADDCALQSATVTPFGMRQVAFEAQESGPCGRWQMLLTKAGQ